MSITVTLSVAVILSLGSIQSAVLERVRRDNPFDEMKTMAAMGIGVAQNTAKDMIDGMEKGVSMQVSKKFEAFGSEIGFNHSMNFGKDVNSSESSGEKTRRRRSFSQLLGILGSGAHRKRRQVMEQNYIAPSNSTSSDADNSANRFLREMGEVWREIIVHIRKWLEGAERAINSN